MESGVTWQFSFILITNPLGTVQKTVDYGLSSCSKRWYVNLCFVFIQWNESGNKNSLSHLVFLLEIYVNLETGTNYVQSFKLLISALLINLNLRWNNVKWLHLNDQFICSKMYALKIHLNSTKMYPTIQNMGTFNESFRAHLIFEMKPVTNQVDLFAPWTK